MFECAIRNLEGVRHGAEDYVLHTCIESSGTHGFGLACLDFARVACVGRGCHEEEVLGAFEGGWERGRVVKIGLCQFGACGLEGLHLGVGSVAGYRADGIALGELGIREDSVCGGVALVACGTEDCEEGLGHDCSSCCN
jgi:hypothetical protein